MAYGNTVNNRRGFRKLYNLRKKVLNAVAVTHKGAPVQVLTNALKACGVKLVAIETYLETRDVELLLESL